MIQIGFAYSRYKAEERLPGWVGPGEMVAALSQSARTLALLTRVRGEPNGEPTTADPGLHQATSSHCLDGRTARQATPGTTRPHFESVS